MNDARISVKGTPMLLHQHDGQFDTDPRWVARHRSLASNANYAPRSYRAPPATVAEVVACDEPDKAMIHERAHKHGSEECSKTRNQDQDQTKGQREGVFTNDEREDTLMNQEEQEQWEMRPRTA